MADRVDWADTIPELISTASALGHWQDSMSYRLHSFVHAITASMTEVPRVYICMMRLFNHIERLKHRLAPIVPVNDKQTADTFSTVAA